MDIDDIPWGRYRLTVTESWGGPQPSIICQECYLSVDLLGSYGMDDAITLMISHEEASHAS